MNIRGKIMGLGALALTACTNFYAPEHFLVHPTIHLIFWGNWDASAQANKLQAEIDGGMLDRLAEYGNTGATLSDQLYQPASIPMGTAPGTYVEDATIDATLESYFRTDAVPPPGKEDFYVVFLPPGTDTVNMIEHGGDAYPIGALHDGTYYTYAVILNVDTDVALSHELYEAITDPYGTGWHAGPNGAEAADMCEPPISATYTLDTFGGVQVAQVWSPSQGKCL